MSHLLHLDSSMRAENSRSRALSRHFAEAWRGVHIDGTRTYRDLAADPIPHLDYEAFTANLTPEDVRTPYQREARSLAELLAGEVLAADEIVIGMPLYNFGPPSTVKAWFDRIVVPGLDARRGRRNAGRQDADRHGGARRRLRSWNAAAGLGSPRALADPRVRAAGPHRHALHPRRAHARSREPADDSAGPRRGRGPEPGRRARRD